MDKTSFPVRHVTGGVASDDLVIGIEEARAQLGIIPVTRASITLTDDQVKALPNTPIEVIAAPGRVNLIVPLAAFVSTSFAGAAYTGTQANAAIALGWNSYGTAWSSIPETSVALLGSNSARIALFPNAAAGGASLVNKNFAVSAINSNGGSPLNFTGGNVANSLRVDVYYTTIDI